MCTKVMNANGSNFAEKNWNTLYADNAYNDVVVNRQSAKFCPSIFVAIQLHGNQPGTGIPKSFGTHTYRIYHNRLLVGV